MFRAEDEIRTRDPHLGKVVLYQLSYVRIVIKNFGSAKIGDRNENANTLKYISFYKGTFAQLFKY
jgi:hypothetical protein